MISHLGAIQVAFSFPLTPDLRLARYGYYNNILLELPEFVKPGQASITLCQRFLPGKVPRVVSTSTTHSCDGHSASAPLAASSSSMRATPAW